jgi:hypothetical protein
MVVLIKEQIIKKIIESTSLSLDDINSKIKQKMDQLAGLISEDGAAHIIANELGVQLIPSTEEALEIGNLLEGLRNVELNVKVTKKFDVKEFNSARGAGKLASFIVADKTGRIRATLWNTKVDDYFNKFQEGDTIKITNAYVKKNNYSGNNDINLSDSSEIIVNPEGIKIDVDAEAIPRKKINELSSNDFRVEILATIVQVSDIRFWETCSQCNKKPKFENDKYICQEHGEIPADKLGHSYVLNCYLDDGSASIRTVFWKDQVQKLLGETHDNIVKFREAPDLFEPFKSSLLGEMIKVTGRINKNDAFDRVELVAQEITKNPDPEEEIKKLKESKPKKLEEVPAKEIPVSQTEIPSINEIEEINIDDE